MRFSMVFYDIIFSIFNIDIFKFRERINIRKSWKSVWGVGDRKTLHWSTEGTPKRRGRLPTIKKIIKKAKKEKQNAKNDVVRVNKEKLPLFCKDKIIGHVIINKKENTITCNSIYNMDKLQDILYGYDRFRDISIGFIEKIKKPKFVYMCHIDFDCETYGPFAIFYDKDEAIKYADSKYTRDVSVVKWEIGKDHWCTEWEVVWEK